MSEPIKDYAIKLDLEYRTNNGLPTFSAYDTERMLKFKFFSRGEEFSTEDYTVVMVTIKPNGNVNANFINDNTYLITDTIEGIYVNKIMLVNEVNRIILPYEFKYIIQADEIIGDLEQTEDDRITLITDILVELSKIQDEEELRIQAEELRDVNEQDRIANEENREEEELIRIDNENTRIANEQSREQNELDRQEYEELRRNKEVERLTNEVARQNAELQRIANENERLRKEIERQNNEDIRLANENDRQAKEETRQANEASRIQNEEERIYNEEIRQFDEEVRKSNEASRVQAEKNRAETFNNLVNNSTDEWNSLASKVEENEKVRIANENIRQENEKDRIANEQTRMDNENTRQENEASREGRIANIEQEQVVQNEQLKQHQKVIATHNVLVNAMYSENIDGRITLVEENTNDVELVQARDGLLTQNEFIGNTMVNANLDSSRELILNNKFEVEGNNEILIEGTYENSLVDVKMVGNTMYISNGKLSDEFIEDVDQKLISSFEDKINEEDKYEVTIISSNAPIVFGKGGKIE